MNDKLKKINKLIYSKTEFNGVIKGYILAAEYLNNEKYIGIFTNIKNLVDLEAESWTLFKYRSEQIEHMLEQTDDIELKNCIDFPQ